MLEFGCFFISKNIININNICGSDPTPL
jgi:hypothetical protein